MLTEDDRIKLRIKYEAGRNPTDLLLDIDGLLKGRGDKKTLAPEELYRTFDLSPEDCSNVLEKFRLNKMDYQRANFELMHEIELSRTYWQNEEAIVFKKPSLAAIGQLREMQKAGSRPTELIEYSLLNRLVWPPDGNSNHEGIRELFSRAFRTELSDNQSIPLYYLQYPDEASYVNDQLNEGFYHRRANWDMDFVVNNLLQKGFKDEEIIKMRNDYNSGIEVQKIIEDFAFRSNRVLPLMPYIEDALMAAFNLSPFEATMFDDSFDVSPVKKEAPHIRGPAYTPPDPDDELRLENSIESHRPQWETNEFKTVKKSLTPAEISILRKKFKQGETPKNIANHACSLLDPPLISFCAYALAQAFHLPRYRALEVIIDPEDQDLLQNTTSWAHQYIELAREEWDTEDSQ